MYGCVAEYNFHFTRCSEEPQIDRWTARLAPALFFAMLVIMKLGIEPSAIAQAVANRSANHIFDFENRIGLARWHVPSPFSRYQCGTKPLMLNSAA